MNFHLKYGVGVEFIAC